MMRTANKKIRRKQSAQKVQGNKKHRCADSENKEMIKTLPADALDYQKKKQPEQASFLYQQVLQQEPDNIYALNGLGVIALDAGMLMLASEFLNAAHASKPNNAIVNQNLGLVYTQLADYPKAIQHYSYILDTDKNNAEIHSELARLYAKIDESRSALKHYRLAFKINPADPGNFQGMVQLDAASISEKDIDIVEKYLLKPNLPLEVRCSFYFSLGKVYDASEKYDEAFANYSVANISKVATFDAEHHVEYIDDIIQTFSAEFFEKQKLEQLKKPDSNNSKQPVFIVGMPQSGITSVARLLSNHDNIYLAGELNLIETIAQKMNISAAGDTASYLSIEDIDSEWLAEFSKFYLNHVNAMATDGYCRVPSRIIDKKPSNFLHLGLIALLFPQAHIIHCVADPLDICLSNYFKNYSTDNNYSYDQKNIVLYYQQYERLMAHWNKVLPLEIHTVAYDDMVKSTEIAGRELFNFIDMTWQSEVVDTSRPRSRIKVKHGAGIKYKAPARHWRYYRKYIHAMLKELMLFNTDSTSGKAANAR